MVSILRLSQDCPPHRTNAAHIRGSYELLLGPERIVLDIARDRLDQRRYLALVVVVQLIRAGARSTVDVKTPRRLRM